MTKKKTNNGYKDALPKEIADLLLDRIGEAYVMQDALEQCGYSSEPIWIEHETVSGKTAKVRVEASEEALRGKLGVAVDVIRAEIRIVYDEYQDSDFTDMPRLKH